MTTTNSGAGKYVFNSTGTVRVTTTNSAYATETMRVPTDLRFAVSQLVAMHDAGWEMCGYAGGADGDKRQFVRVEFRRAVSDA